MPHHRRASARLRAAWTRIRGPGADSKHCGALVGFSAHRRSDAGHARVCGVGAARWRRPGGLPGRRRGHAHRDRKGQNVWNRGHRREQHLVHRDAFLLRRADRGRREARVDGLERDAVGGAVRRIRSAVRDQSDVCRLSQRRGAGDLGHRHLRDHPRPGGHRCAHGPAVACRNGLRRRRSPHARSSCRACRVVHQLGWPPGVGARNRRPTAGCARRIADSPWPPPRVRILRARDPPGPVRRSRRVSKERVRVRGADPRHAAPRCGRPGSGSVRALGGAPGRANRNGRSDRTENPNTLRPVTTGSGRRES